MECPVAGCQCLILPQKQIWLEHKFLSPMRIHKFRLSAGGAWPPIQSRFWKWNENTENAFEMRETATTEATSNTQIKHPIPERKNEKFT